MPARKEYTPEFKDQAVRFVLEEIEPDESREQACERLAPKLSMKAVTLYDWMKLGLSPTATWSSSEAGRSRRFSSSWRSSGRYTCKRGIRLNIRLVGGSGKPPVGVNLAAVAFRSVEIR